MKEDLTGATPDPSPKGEPELPPHVAHVHSNGDFCADRNLGHRDEWPANLFTAEQMRAFYAAGLRAGMLRAAGIADGLDCAHKCMVGNEVARAIRKAAGNAE